MVGAVKSPALDTLGNIAALPGCRQRPATVHRVIHWLWRSLLVYTGVQSRERTLTPQGIKAQVLR